MSRALSKHFLLRAPTIWISKGPKQNLKGPSIEMLKCITNAPI